MMINDPAQEHCDGDANGRNRDGEEPGAVEHMHGCVAYLEVGQRVGTAQVIEQIHQRVGQI